MDLTRHPNHLPFLDGMRGIAILLVMSTHLMPIAPVNFVPLEYVRKVLEAGWIGVDLFFVLSGFLITGILLDSRGSHKAFSRFYARRSLRIFPLYFTILLLGLLILPALGYRYEGQETTQAHQIWLWTYTSNLFAAYQNSYFFTAPGLDLAHFWSLAVEEHFYLFWPLIVLRASVKSLFKIGFIIIASAFLLRCGLVMHGNLEQATYVFTLCRMDTLMLGSLLALAIRLPKESLQFLRPTLQIGGGLAAIFLAVTMFTTKGWWATHWSMQTVGYSALGIFFTALIYFLLQAKDTHPVKRLVSVLPLRLFGKYAYGLYVFHALFDSYLEALIPDHFGPISHWPFVGPLSVLALRIAIVIPITLFSYHILEAPFLRLKSHFSADVSKPTPSTKAHALGC